MIERPKREHIDGETIIESADNSSRPCVRETVIDEHRASIQLAANTLSDIPHFQVVQVEKEIERIRAEIIAIRTNPSAHIKEFQ